jgi:hypothetical protein
MDNSTKPTTADTATVVALLIAWLAGAYAASWGFRFVVERVQQESSKYYAMAAGAAIFLIWPILLIPYETGIKSPSANVPPIYIMVYLMALLLGGVFVLSKGQEMAGFAALMFFESCVCGIFRMTREPANKT